MVEESELTALQQQVEATSSAYSESLDKVEQLKTQMADNQATIDQVGAKLTDQQAKSAVAMKTLYLLQQEGYSLADMVLDSDSISEFLQRIEYIEAVQQQSSDEITKYADMKASYEDAQTELASEKTQAEQESAKAAEALEAAKAARQEAQDRAAREAEEQAKQLVDAGVIDNSVDWSVDRGTFVKQWGDRINAYLAGSSLAGHGETFAQAAWDYGVDPRWSPAISNTESTKGAYIPGGYNAWGWTTGTGGFRTFSSWDDGIRQHVAYLARCYGYTITVAGAAKYCPPGTDWYIATLAQMRLI